MRWFETQGKVLLASRAASQKRKSRHIAADRWMKLVLGGFVVLVLGFLVMPTLVVVGTSFGSGYFVGFPPRSWTMDSYLSIPGSFVNAFLSSARLAFVTVLVGLLITIPASLALVRGSIPGRDAIDATLRSPIQVPHIALGVAMFQYFVLLGTQVGVQVRGTFVGLLIAHVVFVAPYLLIVLVGRVASLDQKLEDAAHGLGASALRTTLTVTLPLMRPAIVAGAILAYLISFNELTVSMFLSGSGATTLPVEMLGVAETELTPVLYAVATLTALISVLLATVVQRWASFRTIAPIG